MGISFDSFPQYKWEGLPSWPTLKAGAILQIATLNTEVITFMPLYFVVESCSIRWLTSSSAITQLKMPTFH
jgi:hypothetical protein